MIPVLLRIPIRNPARPTKLFSLVFSSSWCWFGLRMCVLDESSFSRITPGKSELWHHQLEFHRVSFGGSGCSRL